MFHAGGMLVVWLEPRQCANWGVSRALHTQVCLVEQLEQSRYEKRGPRVLCVKGTITSHQELKWCGPRVKEAPGAH